MSSELLGAAARGAGARAAAHAVSVEVRCPTELTLEADPDRLRQAVDNLLDNAARHAPPDSVVEVNVVEVDATHDRDGMVMIEAADRGPGFPNEFLPTAFERFRRAETARTRNNGGAGLRALDRPGHRRGARRATAHNRPDGGAVVTLELPTTAQPQDAPQPHDQSPVHGRWRRIHLGALGTPLM